MADAFLSGSLIAYCVTIGWGLYSWINSLLDGPEKVVQLSIPAHVECINPGLFVDFVNLVEVEIRGDVYGVEWVAGMGNGTWSASLTPYTLVEELKRAKGRIEIHRSRL